MKGIFKTGLLLLSAMAIGTGSVYAYELLPEEQQLADYFAKRCNTAPQLIQWPVGFEHPVDKFAWISPHILVKPTVCAIGIFSSLLSILRGWMLFH